jgi:hypothetical protein
VRLVSLSLLVLAGCAVQPNETLPSAADAGLVAPLPPKAWLSARVGVEYLCRSDEQPSLDSPVLGFAMPGVSLGEPPGTPPKLAPGSLMVESANPPAPSYSGEEPHADADAPTPAEAWLSEKAIQQVENPFERLTLGFLRNLIGEDRRRVQRQLGAPILFNQLRYSSPDHSLETHLDQRDREDQALLLARETNSLVRGPFRRALRDVTFISDLEVALDDFRAANVPFTVPYEESHPRTNYGSVSVRVRTSGANPFEFGYRFAGWRFRTGQDELKVGYQRQIGENLYLTVQSTYEYAVSIIDLWGDLDYEVSRDTHVHLLFGNKMDIVTGSVMYPAVNSPMVLRAVDESPGVMFYVEHFF